MILEYDSENVFTKALDIVDIGNVTLRCKPESDFEYYVLIKSILGKTHILKVGPILPDSYFLFSGFGCTYKEIDFNEGKILKEISQFVNAPPAKIVEVEEITEYEALSALPNMQDFWQQTTEDA